MGAYGGGSGGDTRCVPGREAGGREISIGGRNPNQTHPCKRGRARQCGPLRDLAGLVEYRNQRLFDEFRHGTGKGAVEHRDLARRADRLAQRHALIEGRDEEHFASCGRERACHRQGAQTVGVGLDHRGALRRRRHPRQQMPILDDSAEVDFEDRAGAIGRAGGHPIALWSAGLRPARGRAARGPNVNANIRCSANARGR